MRLEDQCVEASRRLRQQELKVARLGSKLKSAYFALEAKKNSLEHDLTQGWASLVREQADSHTAVSRLQVRDPRAPAE